MEAGLKYFGITLFDILSLQDEYHHFWDELRTSNVTKSLEEFKSNNYKINYHLVELENLEARAREYYSHCNDNGLQIYGKNTFQVKE